MMKKYKLLILLILISTICISQDTTKLKSFQFKDSLSAIGNAINYGSTVQYHDHQGRLLWTIPLVENSRGSLYYVYKPVGKSYWCRKYVITVN